MKFIVDTQLPAILSAFLMEKQIDCTHTINYPKGSLLSDKEIRFIAIQEGPIVITKDLDFYDYDMLRSFPPKVLLLQLGNSSNRELLNYFRKNIAVITSQFENSEIGLIVCNQQQIVSF